MKYIQKFAVMMSLLVTINQVVAQPTIQEKSSEKDQQHKIIHAFKAVGWTGLGAGSVYGIYRGAWAFHHCVIGKDAFIPFIEISKALYKAFLNKEKTICLPGGKPVGTTGAVIVLTGIIGMNVFGGSALLYTSYKSFKNASKELNYLVE